jgi:hypothetical protein
VRNILDRRRRLSMERELTMCEDCELLNATPVVDGGDGGGFPASDTEASAHIQKTAASIAMCVQ